jgi:enterobacterial common antigen flippase
MTAQTQTISAHPVRKGSYGQILKSSALIGGSSVVNIGFGMVRNKAMAVLLGPAGYGLFGLYNSIYELTRSLAGMGINTSGVRQIAEAVGSQDDKRIARTVTTLRRVALGTGALGGLVLLVFCGPIAWLTFREAGYAGPVALLGLAVLFADVSAGQMALVQGMRRIADLARLNVLGAFYGTVFSIPIIYFFHERGIVPSLVVAGAMGVLSSWWYARKIKVRRVSMTLREILGETSALLKMGLVFMASGLMATGVAYLVRVFLKRQLDFNELGCYVAAWNVGGLYFGYILQAMATDFYPRLTAVSRDNAECNHLVNQQVEIGLLLAGPGVLGTLTFAPLVIELFFSQKFGPAVGVLRWICLGMMLRVVSWPMGYVLVAKGEAKLFFWTELIGNLIHVALVSGGVLLFGLKGAGMAFFGLYVIYGAGIYLVVRRLSGFRWSAANVRLGTLFAALVAGVFGLGELPSSLLATVLGGVVTVLTGLLSFRMLCQLIPLGKLPRFAVAVLRLLRLAGPKDAA